MRVQVSPPGPIQLNNKMNKFIFLDIDGVLNTDSSREEMEIISISSQLFNNFLLITRAHPDAQIIFSSTWRLEETLQTKLFQLFHGNHLNLHKDMFTPEHKFGRFTRQNEITEWLKNHNFNIKEDRMIAIDDTPEDFDSFFREHFLVLCNPLDGLTEPEAWDAIEMLS